MALFTIILLLIALVLYFGAMLALFRLRGTLGIGTFFCALGSLHFMETYLAASFYLSLPFGVSLSPGSVVMFSGKLALLLLVYIREDAEVARQPIYGLLLGNAILIALVSILRLELADGRPQAAGDLSFMDQIGGLMLWGTLLLFVDSIAMILLYERISRPLRRWPVLAIWLTLALVLTFDQAGFFAVLHLSLGVPWSAGLGGWIGKLAAAALYAPLLASYLRRFEPLASTTPRRLADVFGALTYRQRYEELTRTARRDPLTQVLHRGQFEPLGRDLLAVSQTSSRPVSLLLIDIDNFKDVNDHFGHPVGDVVLRRVADAMGEALRQSDYVVRYGGDEFAAFAPGVDHSGALDLAALLRARVAAVVLPGGVPPLTLSIGVATAPQDAQALTDLLGVADKRLYAAKAGGRNTSIGAIEA
ncbi:GGDEF domain-containing protein [Xanthobacter sp. V4C-4]|uniref:GGDEF domain-containing protein n=1 Tax=Xanthobacter cornucopiae TaxID=3119924 RepID=UPI003729C7EC